MMGTGRKTATRRNLNRERQGYRSVNSRRTAARLSRDAPPHVLVPQGNLKLLLKPAPLPL
jgi:hypothetical protein